MGRRGLNALARALSKGVVGSVRLEANEWARAKQRDPTAFIHSSEQHRGSGSRELREETCGARIHGSDILRADTLSCRALHGSIARRKDDVALAGHGDLDADPRGVQVKRAGRRMGRVNDLAALAHSGGGTSNRYARQCAIALGLRSRAISSGELVSGRGVADSSGGSAIHLNGGFGRLSLERRGAAHPFGWRAGRAGRRRRRGERLQNLLVPQTLRDLRGLLPSNR